MNRGELRGYVRGILGEPDPANSYWLDSDLNNYINRGYEDVIAQAELLHCISKTSSKVATLATMPEAGMYSQPLDTLMINRLFYLDPVSLEWTPIPVKTEEEMDREATNWFI